MAEARERENMRRQTLIDAITATDASKKTFQITENDFQYGGEPGVKSSGLGTGDSVTIWEQVNGTWQAAKILDENTTSSVIKSVGSYAVTATLATGGPVSVQLDTTSRM